MQGFFYADLKLGTKKLETKFGLHNPEKQKAHDWNHELFKSQPTD